MIRSYKWIHYLNVIKKTKWPKWVIDKIENYSELKHLIIKAGFNKSDIEIQEK